MVMRIAMQDGVQLKLTILRELVAQHLDAALKARDGGELELAEQLIVRAISYKEQADNVSWNSSQGQASATTADHATG